MNTAHIIRLFKNPSRQYFAGLIVLCSLFILQEAKSQACDPSTPTYIADLTGNPDSVWISPNGPRVGNCCGTSNPDRCVEFILTLDPGAEGIRFDIATGAVPPGALFYQIACGPPVSVGSDLCLSGTGPYRITFCKPGNNNNRYSITSIAKPSVTATSVVSDACTSTISTTGYQPATITWQSIAPGVPGQYNSYLSCTAGCTSTVATYTAGAPAFVDYQVCGVPIGGCTGATVCNTTRVFFVSTLDVSISPVNPTICFGGTSTPITANPVGGSGTYNYLWNTGATTQTINASAPGTYSVLVSDATSCPTSADSVVVTAFLSPITANAGPDGNSCANNPTVTLNGSVQQATGGIWSGGAGTYSPDNTSLTPTYTPTALEISNGSVTHTLTTTGNGTCPSESDVMTVSIAPAPIVDAGANQTVCGNNAATTLAGTVSNAGGGRWSGGTGTFFPNDSTLNAIYSPSAAEITAQTVTLTLTSIQNGTCTPVTDQMTITINPAPTSNAGVDQTVCANNPNVSLAGIVNNATGFSWSGGGGAYNPNANDLNAVYTPSAAEITAQTVTLTLTATRATCNPVTDQMTISITPAPTANAGPDRTVCGNNSAVILNGQVANATGGIWSTSGTGTFNNATALNATYTPSSADTAAGSVTLTLTTTGIGNCIAVTDQMTITYTDAPSANAGIDRTVCANNPSLVLNGSVRIATGGTWSGGGTFSANATTLNATYTPSAAEIAARTATLTLTTTGNGTCNAVTDQMVITITDPPVANAGIDRTVCGNNSAVTLNGSVSVASGGTWTTSGTGSFSNANALNATYTPSTADTAAGSVTLTLTTTGNGTCNAVADQMTITYTDAPFVYAGSDRTVCANNASVTLNGYVRIATGGTWVGGNGTFNPDRNTLNATYTPSAGELGTGVTLTLTTTGNGTCNAVSDAMTISVTPPPTANAGADMSSCANNPNVTLNGSVGVATGGIWSNACGSFLPNANTLNANYVPCQAEIDAGIVSLVLTTTGNGNCIAVTDTVLLAIIPSPTADAGPDQSVCANNPNVSLSGFTTNNSSFVWSGGTGSFNPNINVLDPVYTPSLTEINNGTVTLFLTSSELGCVDVTDPITITITPAPIVNAGPDATVCGNNATVPLNGSVTIGGVTSTGAWTTSGSGTFSPDNTTLNASYVPSSADTAAGTVTLTLTSTTNGTCIAVTDQMVITITDAPTVNAGPDQVVCANRATVTLSGYIRVSTGGTWSSSGTGTFNPNTSTLNATYIPSAADTAAGNVTLTLSTTGNGNCAAVSDAMSISITPAPVVNAGPDQFICANNARATLAGFVTVAGGGIWTGGNGIYNPNNTTLNASYTPTATEVANKTVTLTLTSTGNGSCNQVADNVTITITDAPTVTAGPDQAVCGDAVSVPLSGAVTVAAGGTWSTSGTGTFNPNASTLNASYVPSTADTTAGTVTLTLTTMGNGNCVAVNDQMSITFSDVPFANAGPDRTVCTNDLPVQLNGNATTSTWVGGTGTFSPDRNVLNPTYTPSAAEITAQTVTLTLTTVVNGSCPPASDDITITIPPGPIVDAGADQIICGDVSTVPLNGSVLNAGGGQWTSSGTGTFNPNATTLNASYLPSAADTAAGSVILTLTSTGNGSCTPVADQMTLTITPAPTINAGPDQTVCGDVAGINLNASVSTATGGTWASSGTGTFNDINILNPVYTPSSADTAAHTVTLTITSTGNGTCNAVQDQVVITITPAPTVISGPDQTICADLTSTPVSATFTVASGGVWTSSGTGTFSPNNAVANTSYLPSNADTTARTVTLTFTTTGNGTCNAVSDQIIITINPQPVVNAGPDQVVCADIASFALSGIIANAGGGTWATSGSGTFSPDNLTLNAGYDPSNADTTGQVITLTLTSTGNGTCNAVSDQMVVNFTPAPRINAGLDRTICADVPTVALNATVFVSTGVTWTTSGTGTFNDPNILNPVYTASDADTAALSVTLTATSTGNGTCNPVSDNLVVTISRVPVVDAGPAQTVCGDVAGITLAGSVVNAAGGVWSGGTGTFSPDANTLNATYIPSAAERNGTTFNLSLTSTGNGMCNPVVDQVSITITEPPAINAGPDQTVCADIAAVNLNGSVTIASGGTWTSSGTGTFADANSLITTYTPSATDTSNGVVVLTLTSTGNGTCNAVNDQAIINITPAPRINAGPDRSICADLASIVLNGSVTVASGATWTTSGTGSFSPDANTLNANYIPSAADTAARSATLVLTSTGNGTCNAVRDTMVITIAPAPVVNAGSDVTVCADVSSILLNGASIANALGGTWTSTGTGTFSPNASTINPSYILSANDKAAGNVTLTLTSTGNGTCNAVSDQTLITITPAPQVNAGLDQTVCATTAGVVLNGTVSVATGGTWTTASGAGTFNPDANTLNTTFIPSASQIAAGLAIIRLTSTGNGTCNPVTDDVRITITPAPAVDAGPNQTLCANVSSLSLNGTVTNATGGTWTTSGTGTFTDANALVTTYNPSAADKVAGTITLTLTSTGSGVCSAVSDNVTIGFSAVPAVDAGPSALCTNASGIGLNGTVTNATGGRWTTSSGTGTFTPSQNILTPHYTPSVADQGVGSVRLYLTTTGNGPCPAAVDSIQVGIQPDPTANAGSDRIVCADAGTVNLNGIVTNAGGGIWTSSGGGSFAADATTLNATYTLSAADIINASATLTLTTTGNGFCAAASDQMIITITPAPTVNAGSDVTVCADIAGVSLNGSVNVATGGGWTTSGTGTFSPDTSTLNATYIPSAADTAAGSVTLTLTSTGNGTCIPVSDQKVITITPAPTVNAGDDITICGDVSAIAFTASVTVATGVTWSSSGTGTFNNPNSLTTQYTITAADTAAGLVRLVATTTGNGTCNAQRDTVLITITPAPTVIASAANACADADTIQLSGIITISSKAKWSMLAPASGEFVPNDSTLNAGYVPSAADKISGVVTLVLTTTDNGTCNPVSDTVTLNIVPSPIADAGPDQTVCSNVAGVNLNGTVTNAGGGAWSTLGTGSFPSGATVLNGTYAPSAADTAAHSVRLVLTTTGNGTCSAVTDTLLISFTPAPVVDAGPAVICQGAGAVNLNGFITNAGGVPVWSTAGNGTFGDINALSTTYTPGGLDAPSVVITLTIPGTGTCAPASDNITINITSAPSADANSDQTVCADIASVALSGSVTNAGGGTWSTFNGTGSFGDINNLNTTYTPSIADTAAGSVTVVLTTTGNGVCLPVTDTMVITITPAPTVNAGPASVCANAPPVVLNGSITVATATIWTSSGDGSFADATNLSTTYTPGPSDLVSVTLTLTTTAQGTCNPVSDNITLFIEPPPVANANGDQTICADATGVVLNGSVSGATGGLWSSSGSGSFNPDPTDLGATYVPSAADTAAGTITLTITTTGVAPCNPVSDDMILTINPVPIVNAGPDQTVCGDIANINLNGTVTHAGGGTWSTPNGTGVIANANNLATTYTPTSADTTAGTVTFVLTSTGIGTCNIVRDTMVVTITDAPFVDAGPAFICSDAVSIPLSGIRRVATGVIWTTPGTGTFAPNNISLNTNYIPSVADRGIGSVTLTITTTGNGTCNPVSDNIILYLTPAPTANAGADQGICADALTVNLSGTVMNAGGGTWTTLGSGSFTDANALNTTYTMSNADTAAHVVRLVLTTTGVAPCNPATDTVVINITPAPVAIVNAGNDTTVCESNTDIPLTGTIANAGGGVWTTPNGTGIFTPNAFTLNATYLPSIGDVALGTIELVLESTGNGMCNPITDTMVVTITSRPTADAGANDTVCADISGIPLNGILTTATQGIWSSSGSGNFAPDANTLNGTYIPSAADTADGIVILTLQTIDNGACNAATDNVQFIITPAPTVEAGFPQTVCGDAGSVALSGQVTIASGGTWTSSGTGSFSDANILDPVYTFSSADTAAGTVTLRLTSTGNGTCNPVTDSVVISITNAPVIDAGPDQTICADEPGISLTGFVTVASGAQWTSNGTGFYSPNDVSLNAGYFTSSADTAAGSLTFVLTSTGNGSCNTVRDTMLVTITPAPVVNAGPDQTVCADIGNVGLSGTVSNAPGGTWGTSGTGTFPDPTLLNATYIPSAADTANGIVILNLSSTGTVECNPDVDNMRITITPAPVVNAGPDQTVCADVMSVSVNGTVAIATGGTWSSTGTGTFLDSSSLSTSYIPSAADTVSGTIYLKLTSTGNGTCNPTTDSLRLIFTPKPTVVIGGPQTVFVCADASSVPLNATITVATGGVWATSGSGSFAPNTNTVNANYVLTAADKSSGLVALTLTSTGNGTCNAVTDDVRIRITPAPTVNAGPDQTVCADINVVNLNGSVTVAGGGLWTTSGSGTFNDPTSLVAQYNPSTADSLAGIVNLTLTTTSNGTCNAVSDNMRITLTPAPTVNAGADQGVCADIGSISLNGSVTVASSGVWSTTGSGSFSPNPDGLINSYILSAADTTAGSVALALTTTGNGTCNPVRDTILITIAPAPVVSTGGANICSDVTGVDLNGTVHNASGGIWSTSGSGTFSPNNVTLNGRYNPSPADISSGFAVLTLTSDGNGTCNAVSATMNVTITPLPVANAGSDQLICRGASTVLIAQSVPDVNYAWSTTTGVVIENSGIANITANSDTAFVLTVTDAKGCSVNDTVAVLVVDPPAFNLASSYCFAFGTPMDAAPVPVPVVGTFQWFRNDTLLLGENNSTVIIDQVATYMIGYNYGSCSVFDTTEVTPLPVLNGLDKFVCLGNSVIVNTADIPGAIYQWTENSNPFAGNNDSINVVASVVPYNSSTYIVTVTDVLGCQNNDTIYVIPVPPPNINISNVPSCAGDTVTLNAAVNTIIGWQYEWFRNDVQLPYTDSSIHVNTTGSYMVVYRLGECSTSDTSDVTFYPLPAPSNSDKVTYCNETDITITLDAGPSQRYQWLNTLLPSADTLRTVIVDDPGMYYVTLTNQYNCSVTDSIEVEDVCPPRLFVSQAFVPGGADAGNARFFIKGAYFHNFSITIFNRWGEIIFYSEDQDNAWDGSYRGEPMPAGVYPYIIRYEGLSEKYKGPHEVDGSVVIIR